MMEHEEKPKSGEHGRNAERERPKPPPGFRKFRKMLKRVVNAPPMKTRSSN